MKIGLATLTIGEEYKEITKYGLRTKEIYCKKHNYDLINDISVANYDRHLAWSKIYLILKYLSKYDYLVWIDADTLITNFNISLEFLIERYMNNFELMYAKDEGWVNTGVMFIKNTEFMHRFFTESLNHTNEICWDNGAIDKLWRINWENCKNRIILIINTVFNSYWYSWKYGHFLIHFPGSNEPDRPKNALRRMMDMYCPIKMDEENDENYKNRLKWLENESKKDIPLLHEKCLAIGKYFPLDL